MNLVHMPSNSTNILVSFSQRQTNMEKKKQTCYWDSLQSWRKYKVTLHNIYIYLDKKKA